MNAQHINGTAQSIISCGVSVVAGFVTYSVTYGLIASVAWAGVAIVMALVLSCIASLLAGIFSQHYIVPAADKAVGAMKGWAAALKARRNSLEA